MDCFIFDCDGVIWRGDSVIDGVPETLDMLRAMVRLGGRWLPARRLGPCLAQAAGVCASYRCLQALAAKRALEKASIAAYLLPRSGFCLAHPHPLTPPCPALLHLAWLPGCLQGKQLVFVTNNSTKSRAGYLNKFTGLGLNVKAVSRAPAAGPAAVCLLPLPAD